MTKYTFYLDEQEKVWTRHTFLIEGKDEQEAKDKFLKMVDKDDINLWDDHLSSEPLYDTIEKIPGYEIYDNKKNLIKSTLYEEK